MVTKTNRRKPFQLKSNSVTTDSSDQWVFKVITTGDYIDLERYCHNADLEQPEDQFKKEAILVIHQLLQERITFHWGRMTATQQKYMYEYMYLGKTYQEIADEYGVHYQNVYSAIQGQRDYTRDDSSKFYGGGLNKLSKLLKADEEIKDLLEDFRLVSRLEDQEVIDFYVKLGEELD